jgi:hypothetical protein
MTCLLDFLTHVFYIHTEACARARARVCPTWRRSTWTSKTLNQYFASFIEQEIDKEFATCPQFAWQIIFNHGVGIRSSFRILNWMKCKLPLSLEIPLPCFSAIVKRTQKSTPTRKHQLNKNTSLFTRTRTAVNHNYQPQAQIHYIPLYVVATSIENFGSYLFQELSCLL